MKRLPTTTVKTWTTADELTENYGLDVAGYDQWSGEKRLAFYVLADGLEQYRDNILPTSSERWRIFREIHEWLADEDTTWPWAFRSLCDLFDLDAEWIRAQLRRLAENATASLNAPVDDPSESHADAPTAAA